MISHALENIESLRSDFQRDGYVILPGYFSNSSIDSAVAAVAELLATRGDEIVVDSLTSNQREYWKYASDRESGRFKFNDLYLISDVVRGIALELGLSRLLAALLGSPPVLCNSLNFRKGSGQPKHIDSLFMTPTTPHALIATWTALEDGDPDAGPLIYFPASHLIPLYRFKSGTYSATESEMPAWTAYIEEQIRRRGLEQRSFIAKKGDVFVWHSDLVHGGGAINDPGKTRNSLVCHYFTRADCVARHDRIEAYHGGFWLNRLRHPIKPAPEVFGPHRPFPEKEYLTRHPDVRVAVEAGHIPSGWHHYNDHGYAEGRGI